MAIGKPVNVPKKNITSVDITGFSGGLYLNGEQNAKGNQMVESSNVEISLDGFLTERKSLQPWLPDTVEDGFEIFPALWDGQIVNYTADDGKIKWAFEGSTTWTDCGGANSITTGGAKIKLLRVADVILILGGDGGNRLAYVDLATKNVIKYTFVSDPASALTAVATGIALGGSYKIYYGYTFSSATGETKISPILNQNISKTRDQWKTDGSEYLTLTRPAGNPAGAKFWNLYIALAANGGIVQDSDMLMLAAGLDLGTLSIVDNGTLAIDIGRGNPPAENSTDGPRVKFGIETNGRPVLFGDIDNPHNVWIGGDGEYALDFSASNGGYRSEPSKGTNYYPASVIGFRNGQGIPSLTILFSNTQGVSKQATLEQQTITYGNQSFVVWGITEQNYGAAGVASAHSVINYKGQLAFASSDGMMSMDTQPSLQNVLATKEIDNDIRPLIRSIKTSALANVVGTAWENQQLWLLPSYGFDKPQQIAIRDLNNNGAWVILDIPAQWIGTVSPPDSPAFVYIRQGKRTLKLFESFGTVDYLGGQAVPFATNAKGALMGINEAHNAYQAVVQAVFYLMNVIGNVTIGVNYRNESGKMKTKKKIFKGPAYVLSSAGGWSDPAYVYAGVGMPIVGGWDAVAPIDISATALQRVTKRVPLQMNVLASEVQWFVITEKGYNSFMLRAVSYEGENLGVKPDLR